VTIDKGYNGNPLLKKSRKQIAWSSEMLQEFLKCAQDPIYFAEKYIQIVHVDRGLIPIKLYDYQKEIIVKITNSRRVTVCTSRQAGKTTTAAAIILHYILFNDHKTVALLANKGDAAREILDRIKLSYESLPDWLQQGVVEWNKGSIELENGCKVIAAATSSSAIRGKSISLLYIDEAAFVEGWDEFFASVFPTISSGETTKILFTSTPNGLNHFYKTCMGAMADKNTKEYNGYEYVEVPWQKVPGRDIKWKEETLAAMDFDLEKFAQEFECAWLGSSGTLISGAVLKTLVAKTPINAKEGLTQYFLPVPKHSYVISVDVSRGKGLDYSAFHVIDVTTMPYQQVCTYRSNLVTPLDYTDIIHRIGKAYNNASVLVEVNDVGQQVADSLFMDYEYENIVYTHGAGPRGKQITSGFGKNMKKVERGVRTTKIVKAVGCSMLKLLVEQYQLIINDHDTIHELSRFSKKGTSYQAEPGANDDLAMSLVLFAWMTDQQFFKELTDINTLQKLRDRSEEEMEHELFDFYHAQDGLDEEYSDDNAIDLINNPMRMAEFRGLFS
jgi:hypothetical protein